VRLGRRSATWAVALVLGLLPLLAMGAPAANPVSPSTSLEPDFELDVDVVQEGPVLTLEIRFDNVGGGVARTVVLSDDLPDGTTYLGDPGDVVNGTWTKTRENLAPGEYRESIAVRLPDEARTGDRIRNLLRVRYAGFSGAWHSDAFESEFALAFGGEPASTGPSWVAAAPAGAGLAGIGVAVAYRRRHRRPRLEQVFLMHNSGMLIHHWAASVSPSRDIDILSGMFVILKEFVRDSFREKAGGLTEFQFGDSRVFLAEGEHAILAAVVDGDRVNGLPGEIRSAVQDFEDRYGDVLARWSGRLESLPDAKAVVERLVRGGYAHWRVAA